MFTDEELASYLRVESLDLAWVDLKREIVESEITDITGELDPVPAWVKGIALEAIARAWINPARRKSETFGSATFVNDTAGAPAGSGYLTTDEIARLRRLAGGRSSVSSIRLTSVLDCPAADLEALPTP